MTIEQNRGSFIGIQYYGKIICLYYFEYLKKNLTGYDYEPHRLQRTPLFEGVMQFLPGAVTYPRKSRIVLGKHSGKSENLKKVLEKSFFY